ncbi:DUF262 domain-containing protein [Pantoea agglomerans]|uniref:DUF262 domain-containing protein n=1 Tax=Enterobacter agglomerans TaxID=549 RepID=UPI0016540C23|nr:DUF262 domain-containing protein [Pantoea agglomerans]
MSQIDNEVVVDAAGLPVENVDDSEQGNQPYQHIKERKVLIQPYDYAVRTLMDMIIDEDLILEPDYQRKYQWDTDKASRFIESICLNIPVPVVYLAEEKDGTFSVIDGQQRLTSLFRFIKHDELNNVFPAGALTPLTLENLKILPELNGKNYNQLDRGFKSSISKRPIRCIVVLNDSDETLKFEVFERLNTGSAQLTAQEIRNCVYRGSYNKLLKSMAEYPKFKELIAIPSADDKAMKASELVLRFLAYRELTSQTDYSDNYAEYLNLHMDENKELSQTKEDNIRNIFESTVDLIYDTLGPGVAFRKPKDRNDATQGFYKNLINGSIYESQMVAFSRAFENGITNDLHDKAFSAFRDDDYWNSLFQGTSKKNKALKRSQKLTEFLLG